MTETAQHENGTMTVGRTAELVGVSVRTLHHWDQIGLVTPSGRTWSDYRLYDSADVARIHRVLVYREIGLPLAEISRVLDDPHSDPGEHLHRQRTLLRERIRRLERAALAVDEMIERTNAMTENTGGQTLTPEEQAEIFGTDWNPVWQDEARQRWGDTDAWAQSEARAQAMTPQQWRQVKQDHDALNADLAAAMDRGIEPGSQEAGTLAERHRDSISVAYDCSHSMHVLLARMYTEDPRFTETYDKVAPGLAGWLRQIIEANARVHGVDPETAVWE